MAFSIRPNAIHFHTLLGHGFPLLNDVHFFYQMSAVSQFFQNEEYIADVQCDATLQVVVEVDVTAQGFPVAVECTADKLSFTVDDGTAGVAAGDVVGGQEANGHCAVGHGIASEVFIEDKLLQFGGHYEFAVFGVSFQECRPWWCSNCSVWHRAGCMLSHCRRSDGA